MNTLRSALLPFGLNKLDNSEKKKPWNPLHLNSTLTYYFEKKIPTVFINLFSQFPGIYTFSCTNTTLPFAR